MSENSGKSCPCEFGNPCRDYCSCANPLKSGGCLRCCKYGSKEEQEKMAAAIIAVEDRNLEAIIKYGKVKAPKGCVIDDEGSVIEGTWTHKNGGHNDFHWRFDATESTNDDD